MAKVEPVVVQPAKHAYNAEFKPSGVGKDWQLGICDVCHDCESYYCTMWCSMCRACDIAFTTGEYCAIHLVNPTGLFSLRQKVRQSLGIRGSSCGDFCCTHFCGCCATEQMYQELVKSGKLQKRDSGFCNCDPECLIV